MFIEISLSGRLESLGLFVVRSVIKKNMTGTNKFRAREYRVWKIYPGSESFRQDAGLIQGINRSKGGD